MYTTHASEGSGKFNDKVFFLIVIAFISAFNYYLTYDHIKFNWSLVLTYTLDTIEGWVAWWAVRSLIKYLDARIPYGREPFKRILIQLLLTTLAGLLVIVFLTALVSWIAVRRPPIPSFYSFDIFIIIIWFIVINGIYIGMHYYTEWRALAHRLQEESQARTGGFTVKQGKMDLLIPFTDIAAIYTDAGYSILLNWEGKKYLPDSSLDKIEKALPCNWFLRLNRQYILHRGAITGFKRLGDGKIEVLTKPLHPLPASVQVSRLKAASFKNWFRSDAPEEIDD
jgi:DNA-binding LytR/AlgR family response regulator